MLGHDVDRRIVLTMLGDASELPVPASLAYDAGDPYAVLLTFAIDPMDSIEWIFSRELLSDGMHHAAGLADVRVWPGPPRPDRTYLQLRSPSGEALFSVPTPDLVEFLAGTHRLVPAGTESSLLGLDDAVDLFLSGGPGVTPG